MLGVKELKQKLGNQLNWHGSRIDFLAKFMLALIAVRTVNLAEIALGFGGRAQVDSNYKRLQRFLKKFELDYDEITKVIANLIPISGPWYLTIDRTNWKFGRVNINILVLGIAYEGIAFPLLWSLLPKAGNSNTEERIALMERFICLFGHDRIACLLGDREFKGKQWFDFLLDSRIKFRIRLQKNILIENSRGKLVSAFILFRNLKAHQYRTLSTKRLVWDHKFYVAGTKLSNGDFLIVVSSDFPANILTDYAKRWEIETLFGCLKSRGFRFEDTHLTDPERISKLLSLLAITFVWAYLTGEWLSKNKKSIPFKKTINRPLKSVFTHGLEHLRNIILNLYENFQSFIRVVKLLSCT